MNLSVHSKSIPQTKAMARESLKTITAMLAKNDNVFNQFLISEISEFKKAPSKFKIFKTPQIPDGSPIGSFECYHNMN